MICYEAPHTCFLNHCDTAAAVGSLIVPCRSPMKPYQVDLSSYHATGFDRGAGVLKESLWLIVSLVLFRLCPFSLSPLKRTVCALWRHGWTQCNHQTAG